MIERWAPVAGYESLYAVSDHGRIKSLRNGKVMTPVRVSDGYLAVKLYRAGVPGRFSMHRLVCAAFNGPPQEGQQAAHLDGVRTNNLAENLAWVTPKENTSHKIGHHTHQAGETHPRAKLTAAQVAEIRASNLSRAQIAEQFGISYWTVKQLRHRNSGRWLEASQSGPKGIAQ